MAWFVQPFFEHIHLTLQWFGILWTALRNLTVGIVAFIAYRIEARLGQIQSILIIAILVPAEYQSVLLPFCLCPFHSVPLLHCQRFCHTGAERLYPQDDQL